MSTSSHPRTTSASTTARIEWIDGARGGAMVLLLVWHAASIPEVLGTPMPRVVETLNDGLHLVRMPLLMFLSGMVAVRALSRPAGVYYRGKLATLAWPYVLWALLDMTTYDHLPLTEPWSWDGTGYLWFLFFVLCFSLVAPLLRRVPAWLVAAVAVVGASTAHLPFPDDDMLFYAVFFFAGLAAAQRPELFAAVLRSIWIVVPCALVGATACVLWAMGHHPNEGHVAPLALAGVVAVVAGVSRIPRHPPALQRIGRRSIVWYLVHFPLMHLAVVLLDRSGLDAPWVVYFVVALALAVLVCPLVVRLADRAPTKWLFSAPPPLSAR